MSGWFSGTSRCLPAAKSRSTSPKTLPWRTGVETRSSALGHIQRGGAPIPADRILATHFGYHAIKILAEGKRGRMVVRQGNAFGDVDLL
ncbi:MAG: 6-phosphofructokinase, partial [Phycisphaerales bacterium]